MKYCILKTINGSTSGGIPSTDIYKLFYISESDRHYNLVKNWEGDGVNYKTLSINIRTIITPNLLNHRINDWSADTTDLYFLKQSETKDSADAIQNYLEIIKTFPVPKYEDLVVADGVSINTPSICFENYYKVLVEGHKIILKTHSVTPKDFLYFDMLEDYFGKERVDIDSNYIYIYFPVKDVTNSNNVKHTIYETFIKLCHNFDDREYLSDHMLYYEHLDKNNSALILKIVGIRGLRTLVSKDEYTSGYSFSHFSRGHGGWADCCLGGDSQPLRKFLHVNLDSEHKIIAFASALDSYLTWESLEGGPYIKISDIKSSNTNSNSLNISFTERVKSILGSIAYNRDNIFSYIDPNNFTFQLDKKVILDNTKFFISKDGTEMTLERLNSLKSSKTKDGEIKGPIDTISLNEPFNFKGEKIRYVKIDESLNKKKKQFFISKEYEPYDISHQIQGFLNGFYNKTIEENETKYIEQKPAYIIDKV